MTNLTLYSWSGHWQLESIDPNCLAIKVNGAALTPDVSVSATETTCSQAPWLSDIFSLWSLIAANISRPAARATNRRLQRTPWNQWDSYLSPSICMFHLNWFLGESGYWIEPALQGWCHRLRIAVSYCLIWCFSTISALTPVTLLVYWPPQQADHTGDNLC